MQRFEDVGPAIHVVVDEAFVIALRGNPTTGYLWEAEIDTGYLELVQGHFEQDGEGVGAGGRQAFHFRARSPGETQVTFEHRRPWDKIPRETRCFQVVIG
jgi:inhibitor of cysteine peptidase